MNIKNMTRTIPVLAALLWAGPAAAAGGKMRVLATTDYLGSLAQTVGGDKIKVDYLSPAGFDADNYSPRPQDLFKIHRAKLFIMVGLSLEDWARDLVNAANNPGLIKAEVYQGVKLMDVPKGSVDFSFGDIHPHGNPHFQLDPEDGRIMARNIKTALAYADPDNRDYYEKNLADFEVRLTAAESRWKKMMAPYKGWAFTPYHEDMDYFARAFQLSIPKPPNTIEEKPGFVPSPRRIEEVIKQAGAAGVKLIVTEPYYDVSIGKAVATGAKLPLLIVSLYDIGLDPKQTDYISMEDAVVTRFAQAFGGHGD